MAGANAGATAGASTAGTSPAGAGATASSGTGAGAEAAGAGSAGMGATAGVPEAGSAAGAMPAGSGAGADAGGGAAEATIGCEDGVELLPLPQDPGQRGPWKVGVRTVTIGRLTVEVVYPAEPGSTEGVPEAFYDLRAWLPESERSKVPDEASPDVKPIGGELYRDVPIDALHGPYPVVIHVHGTSSIRIASGSSMVHWASHGFIVMAADHPGLMLKDQLSLDFTCGFTAGTQDLLADVRAEIDAIANPSGELAFIGDRADASRVAINGHSQGGCVSATMSTLPGVRMVIPFSGAFPTLASETLEAVMYIGGTKDTVIGWGLPEGNVLTIGNWVCPPGSTTTREAYVASPGPPAVKKRLLGVTGGGHLAPTDLCQENDLGNGALEELVLRGVCGVNSAAIIGLAAIFDCGPAGQELTHEQSLAPINYATTAGLEETLLCQDRSGAFAKLKERHPMAVFEENL